MRPRALPAALACAVVMLSAALPACAEDDRIWGQPYNVTSAPASVDVCNAVRSDYHEYFAVTFHDIAPETLVAVEITSELYDPFGTFLTSVPETFTGTYSPNVPIEDLGLSGAGQVLPVTRTADDYETAREDVCYVSAVKFADGTIWRAEPGHHAPAP